MVNFKEKESCNLECEKKKRKLPECCIQILKGENKTKLPETCLQIISGKKKDKLHEDQNLEGRNKIRFGKRLPQVQEFKGPLKLVLVDGPEDSERKRTAAGFISLANMMIAANTMIMILFSLSFNFPRYINIHIILCTIGFQFCLPLSILIVHPLYGPAEPMDEGERIWEHIKMLILGMICMFGSYHLIIASKASTAGTLGLSLWTPFSSMKNMLEKIRGVHINAGLLTMGCLVLSILTAITLPICKMYADKPSHQKLPSLYSLFLYLHRYLGMLTLLLSNISYICGVLTAPMQFLLFLHGYLVPTIAILTITLVYTIIMIVFRGWRYAE